jgi:hypothetical protein
MEVVMDWNRVQGSWKHVPISMQELGCSPAFFDPDLPTVAPHVEALVAVAVTILE